MSFHGYVCSCGVKKDHVMATRKTADDKVVKLWSDGGVTSALGTCLPGIGTAKSAFETKKNVEAGWLAFAEVELYDFSEVSALVKAARRAVRNRFLDPRDYMLRSMKGEKFRVGKHGVVTGSKVLKSRAFTGGSLRDIRAHMEVCRSLNCGVCGTKRGGKKRHATVEFVRAHELRAGDVVFPRYLHSKTREPATITGAPVSQKDRFGTARLAFPAKSEERTGNIYLGTDGGVHRLPRSQRGGKKRHATPKRKPNLVAEINALLKK